MHAGRELAVVAWEHGIGGEARAMTFGRRHVSRAALALFGALALFALVHGTARAADPVPRIVLTDENVEHDVPALRSAVLEDPSGDLGIDEVVRSRAFGSMPHLDRADWRRSTFWFRLSLVRPAGNTAAWYLSASAECESVELYEPDARGGFVHHSFGWSIPYARHPSPGDGSSLALDAAALSGGTLFLRLTCPASLTDVSVESALAVAADSSDRARAIIAPIGVMLVFVALGLAFSVVTRERIYLLSAGPPFAFSLYFLVASHSLYTFAFSGLMLSWSLPPYHETLELSAAVFFVAQWAYMRAFLEMPTRMKRLDRLIGGTIVVLFVLRLECAFGPRDLAFENALLEMMLYGIPLGGAIVAWRNGSRRARFFVVGLSVTAASVVATTMAGAGVFRAPGFLSEVLFLWSIPFESLTLFIGIADRLRRSILDNAFVLAESDAAKATLLEAQGKHIEDVERRNVSFARFVPSEFLEQLERDDLADVMLGDHAERTMSVLFTDIRGFTTIVEALTPGETFAFLNSYLELAGPGIREHAGFIDKYIGDAIMALFPRKPADAVEAALTLQRAVRRFNEDRARHGGLPISVGIGINHGTLMLGTIGERQRLETTVLADAVNIASRLEGLTKRFGAGIIAGEALVRALPEGHPYHLRPLGTVQLKGFTKPVGAYEIFDGDPSDLLLHKRRTLERFATALAAYRRGDFTESRASFAAIAQENEHDCGAAWLRDRSALFAETVDFAWDGIDRLESK